jgi:hypothetical protein
LIQSVKRLKRNVAVIASEAKQSSDRDIASFAAPFGAREYGPAFYFADVTIFGLLRFARNDGWRFHDDSQHAHIYSRMT